MPKPTLIRFRRLAALLLSLVLLPAAVSGEAPSEDEVNRIFKKYKTVGGMVLAAKDGEIVFSHCYGMANKVSKESITPDTYFKLASVSKLVTAAAVMKLVETGHRYRMEKLEMRLDHLKSEFGVVFPKEEVDSLYQMDNPGKPHIGNLMVQYGYAPSRNEAINKMINKLHVKGQYFTPDQAIEGILGGGGIPVLAHPSYGSGDQLIIGEEMDRRLRKLMGYGLKGVEAFYSGFNRKLQDEVLGFAEKYNLYVTAGSDYHGRNKLVVLGDTNLEEGMEYPPGLVRFLEDMEPEML